MLLRCVWMVLMNGTTVGFEADDAVGFRDGEDYGFQPDFDSDGDF